MKHPNWAMGRKITIDSSTMVNKGLEVIEAKWLFGVDVDQIQVVVQPQSIIHRKIKYLQIPEIIQACMEAHKNIAAPTVEEILKTEQETYEFIKNRW